MEWLSVPSVATGLVAAGLIYFFVKNHRTAVQFGGDSRDVSSNAVSHDGAPMPFLARGTLIVYLILLGALVVYLLVALNSVELPEPTLLPEGASSQLTSTPATQNQNAGKKPAAMVDKEIPVILEVFPSAALGSTPTLSLSIYGRNFHKDAVVRFNTRERTQKFITDDLLKVQLEPMDMVNVGAISVDVINPGNRISNSITVPIMKPRAPLHIPGFGEKPPLITREVQLLLLALVAGALGSYLHAIKSLADFIGNRTLTASWFWWYISRPFLGMAMALVFYSVLRGGFLTGTPADTRVINPFGVIAVGALVGMFADKAAQKLGEIFDTLFKSQDVRGGKLIAPVIDRVQPATIRLGDAAIVKIIGDRLGKVSRVRVNSAEHNPENVSEKEVTFKLNQEDVAKTGELKISVLNPDGGVSAAADLHVTDLDVTEPAALPDATAASPYQQQLKALGGADDYKWSLDGRPSWLNVTKNGLLSGTPPSAGTSKFLVIVSDKNGASVTKEYDLKIAPPKVP